MSVMSTEREVQITVEVDTQAAEAELERMGHLLYKGCFVLKCIEQNHFVTSCQCDGVMKRMYFVDHDRWCEAPEPVAI
jgi:hypothetical protein